MASDKIQLVVLATFVVRFMLILTPSMTANVATKDSSGAASGTTMNARVRRDGGGGGGGGQGQDGERQWDMNFPYLLMMLNGGGSVVVPSLWLIPVVVTAGFMLFIRATATDWA